jgi:hypothetical protein
MEWTSINAIIIIQATGIILSSLLLLLLCKPKLPGLLMR